MLRRTLLRPFLFFAAIGLWAAISFTASNTPSAQTPISACPVPPGAPDGPADGTPIESHRVESAMPVLAIRAEAASRPMRVSDPVADRVVHEAGPNGTLAEAAHPGPCRSADDARSIAARFARLAAHPVRAHAPPA